MSSSGQPTGRCFETEVHREDLLTDPEVAGAASLF